MNSSDLQREGLGAERRWARAFLEGRRGRFGGTDGRASLGAIRRFGQNEKQVLASFLVKFYSDTAVVGRWRAKGSTWGEIFDYAARFVSVDVWRSEGWRMVMNQSTPLGGETNG